MREEGSGAHLSWGVASRPYPGERVCGDLHCVRQEAGFARVAVVDGLGHGEEAAEAARVAVERLSTEPFEPLPEQLLAKVHRALRPTRGAAVSLVEIDPAANWMRWIGVGNVEGLRVRPSSLPDPQTGAPRGRERLLLRGGVVGQNMPNTRPSELALMPGDVLVLATDGIRASFADALRVQGAPLAVANRILADHARPTDDALVLVARYHASEVPGAGEA